MQRNSNSFMGLVSSVADGTQPAAGFGTVLTPGDNAYGSFVEMIGSVAGTTLDDDAYMIEIIITEGFTASAARDILITLGFDASGGTSYTSWTIDHLLGSSAGSLLSGGTATLGPIVYRFPVFVKSGTSIAAKASVNNATVGTVACLVNLFTKPTHPELIRVGTKVVTFGADTTASNGAAAVTPGTTSEGAWAAVGSAISATDGPLWYWEFGMGINDASIAYTCYVVDIGIGDASNKKMAITNAHVYTITTEAISKPRAGEYMEGAVGDIVYARMQSNRIDDDISIIAYGVGG